jgi:hypothetical protein
MSATLFVISVNMFLIRIRNIGIPQMTLRAAADDLGAVLHGLADLIPLHAAFKLLK